MMITVSMGEGAAAAAPHVLRAGGCGSCVILILYDSKARVGGLVHIMLPSSGSVERRLEPGGEEDYRYADTAVPRLLDDMDRMGASRGDITAKLVGGAAMFPSYSSASAGIGRQNIEGVKGALERACILLAGWDTGGARGRNVEFHVDSGRVIVTAFGAPDREI